MTKSGDYVRAWYLTDTGVWEKTGKAAYGEAWANPMSEEDRLQQDRMSAVRHLPWVDVRIALQNSPCRWDRFLNKLEKIFGIWP
jgi:hypothetical protein